MSTDIRTTMEIPHYEARRALFRSAVGRAHQERAMVMRRLVEAVFGRRSDEAEMAPQQVDIDRARLISMESLAYGRTC